MKRLVAWFLLLPLLLCGCRKEPGDGDAPQGTQETVDHVGLYDPNHLIGPETEGAVRAYPLNSAQCSELAFLGGNLLLAESDGNADSTKLTVLEEDALYRRITVGIDARIGAGELHTRQDSLAYYDPGTGEVVLLDAALTEKRRVPMPDGILDAPVIGENMDTAYCCVRGQIRAVDLNSGEDRLVWEHGASYAAVDRVLLSDSVLEVSLYQEDGESTVVFLDSDTGERIGEDPGIWAAESRAGRYFVQRSDGTGPQLIYGRSGEGDWVLQPGKYTQVYPLLQMYCALTVSEDGTLCLYDLESGKRTAQIAFRGTEQPVLVREDPGGEYIWVLVYDRDSQRHILCRWEWRRSLIKDQRVYGTPRVQSPDTQP